MDEPFILELIFQNKTYELETGFQRYGYIYRIAVTIDGLTVLFEPDEEGNYRALVSQEQIEKNKTLSVGLLQTIAQKLENLSK
jgi:hypothetical protein